MMCITRCIFYTADGGQRLKELISSEFCEHCKARGFSVVCSLGAENLSEQIFSRSSPHGISVKHIAHVIPYNRVNNSEREAMFTLIEKNGGSFGEVIRVREHAGSMYDTFVILRNAMLHCNECGISKKHSVFIGDHNLLMNYIFANNLEVRDGLIIYSSTCQTCLEKKAISIKE